MQNSRTIPPQRRRRQRPQAQNEHKAKNRVASIYNHAHPLSSAIIIPDVDDNDDDAAAGSSSSKSITASYTIASSSPALLEATIEMLRDRYSPAFPGAGFDTQGFCLKHPTIRVRQSQSSSSSSNSNSFPPNRFLRKKKKTFLSNIRRLSSSSKAKTTNNRHDSSKLSAVIEACHLCDQEARTTLPLKEPKYGRGDSNSSNSNGSGDNGGNGVGGEHNVRQHSGPGGDKNVGRINGKIDRRRRSVGDGTGISGLRHRNESDMIGSNTNETSTLSTSSGGSADSGKNNDIIHHRRSYKDHDDSGNTGMDIRHNRSVLSSNKGSADGMRRRSSFKSVSRSADGSEKNTTSAERKKTPGLDRPKGLSSSLGNIGSRGSVIVMENAHRDNDIRATSHGRARRKDSLRRSTGSSNNSARHLRNSVGATVDSGNGGLDLGLGRITSKPRIIKDEIKRKNMGLSHSLSTNLFERDTNYQKKRSDPSSSNIKENDMKHRKKPGNASRRSCKSRRSLPSEITKDSNPPAAPNYARPRKANSSKNVNCTSTDKNTARPLPCNTIILKSVSKNVDSNKTRLGETTNDVKPSDEIAIECKDVDSNTTRLGETTNDVKPDEIAKVPKSESNDVTPEKVNGVKKSETISNLIAEEFERQRPAVVPEPERNPSPSEHRTAAALAAAIENSIGMIVSDLNEGDKYEDIAERCLEVVAAHRTCQPVHFSGEQFVPTGSSGADGAIVAGVETSHRSTAIVATAVPVQSEGQPIAASPPPPTYPPPLQSRQQAVSFRRSTGEHNEEPWRRKSHHGSISVHTNNNNNNSREQQQKKKKHGASTSSSHNAASRLDETNKLKMPDEKSNGVEETTERCEEVDATHGSWHRFTSTAAAAAAPVRRERQTITVCPPPTSPPPPLKAWRQGVPLRKSIGEYNKELQRKNNKQGSSGLLTNNDREQQYKKKKRKKKEKKKKRHKASTSSSPSSGPGVIVPNQGDRQSIKSPSNPNPVAAAASAVPTTAKRVTSDRQQQQQQHPSSSSPTSPSPSTNNKEMKQELEQEKAPPFSSTTVLNTTSPPPSFAAPERRIVTPTNKENTTNHTHQNMTSGECGLGILLASSSTNTNDDESRSKCSRGENNHSSPEGLYVRTMGFEKGSRQEGLPKVDNLHESCSSIGSTVSSDASCSSISQEEQPQSSQGSLSAQRFDLLVDMWKQREWIAYSISNAV